MNYTFISRVSAVSTFYVHLDKDNWGKQATLYALTSFQGSFEARRPKVWHQMATSQVGPMFPSKSFLTIRRGWFSFDHGAFERVFGIIYDPWPPLYFLLQIQDHKSMLDSDDSSWLCVCCSSYTLLLFRLGKLPDYHHHHHTSRSQPWLSRSDNLPSKRH